MEPLLAPRDIIGGDDAVLEIAVRLEKGEDVRDVFALLDRIRRMVVRLRGRRVPSEHLDEVEEGDAIAAARADVADLEGILGEDPIRPVPEVRALLGWHCNG
jgi:hypothetical protein